MNELAPYVNENLVALKGTAQIHIKQSRKDYLDVSYRYENMNTTSRISAPRMCSVGSDYKIGAESHLEAIIIYDPKAKNIDHLFGLKLPLNDWRFSHKFTAVRKNCVPTGIVYNVTDFGNYWSHTPTPQPVATQAFDMLYADAKKSEKNVIRAQEPSSWDRFILPLQDVIQRTLSAPVDSRGNRIRPDPIVFSY